MLQREVVPALQKAISSGSGGLLRRKESGEGLRNLPEILRHKGGRLRPEQADGDRRMSEKSERKSTVFPIQLDQIRFSSCRVYEIHLLDIILYIKKFKQD